MMRPTEGSPESDALINGFSSPEKRWRFETREDNGWQVVKVNPPRHVAEGGELRRGRTGPVDDQLVRYLDR